MANNLLLDQVGTQLRQGPLGQPDQLGWRRQRHLGNFLHDLNHESAWAAWCLKIRIPLDGLQPIFVEAMDDHADPLRRATNSFGNCPVANTPRREENNSRMAAVDLIAQLSFHTMQLGSFPTLNLLDSYRVHLGVSASNLVISSHNGVETPLLFILIAHPTPRSSHKCMHC